MKRLLSWLLVLCLLAGLTACKKDTPPAGQGDIFDPVGEKMDVQVCLPATETPWISYGEALKAEIEALGHSVQRCYAQNDLQEQLQQIAEAVETGASCLVVVPVDAILVADALAKAEAAGVKVLILDRQMTNSQNISVTFDYLQIGRAIANQIVQAKDLENAKKKKYTIEFFMGSADDHRSVLIYQGIMEVLQTYLDSGTLVCKTGRTALEDICIQNWDTEQARKKCKTYLKAYDEPVDILCAASDSIAQGCIAALEAAKYKAENWPVITGQGGEVASLQAIVAGKQTATIRPDADALIKKCAQLAHLMLTDGTLPAPDDADAALYLCPAEPVYGPEAAQALLPELPPETTEPAVSTDPTETTAPAK